MNRWLSLIVDGDAESGRSPQDKWAAVILAAAVLCIGGMYNGVRLRKGGEPKARPQAVNIRPANHLAGSASPYLLQHSHNPVDWYPWGPEALQRARTENRPIFLSVGYSACHWCHVMEREDFENEAIARIMNTNFVCVKVDREERPDIDDQYQTAVQIITGSGGWPMSVWLTPDLKPFHAGTYFPPAEFESILGQLASLWTMKRATVMQQADLVVSRMLQVAKVSAATSGPGIPTDIDERATAAMLTDCDQTYGGFGDKPKFPEAPRLTYLLNRYQATHRGEILLALNRTLDHMAKGGIHDQLDGGFHRYSTDRKWQVPHFEKMLYDQALLADVYFKASVIIKDKDKVNKPEYRNAAEGILNFVLADMTDPKTGGFYTSIDADSDGEEGKYYVWSRSEVTDVLGKVAGDEFNTAYGVAAYGNFQDEMNVLHQSASLNSHQIVELAPLREKLLLARRKRVHPPTDDKIVCGLNGLMIEAMANAYSITGDVRYRAAAERAGDYVTTALMKPDGQLLRMARAGSVSSSPGFLEDYAYVARGMLANFKAFHDERWLARAELIVNQMNRLYWRRGEQNGFVSPGPEGSPISSSVEGEDNAIPSPTGIAAVDLVELANRRSGSRVRPSIEVDRLRSQASMAVKAFCSTIVRSPAAFPSLLTANGMLAASRANVAP